MFIGTWRGTERTYKEAKTSVSCCVCVCVPGVWTCIRVCVCACAHILIYMYVCKELEVLEDYMYMYVSNQYGFYAQESSYRLFLHQCSRAIQCWEIIVSREHTKSRQTWSQVWWERWRYIVYTSLHAHTHTHTCPHSHIIMHMHTHTRRILLWTVYVNFGKQTLIKMCNNNYSHDIV